MRRLAERLFATDDNDDDDDFRATTRYYADITGIARSDVQLEIIKSCSYAPTPGAKPINLRTFQSRFSTRARARTTKGKRCRVLISPKAGSLSLITMVNLPTSLRRRRQIHRIEAKRQQPDRHLIDTCIDLRSYVRSRGTKSRKSGRDRCAQIIRENIRSITNFHECDANDARARARDYSPRYRTI